MGCDENKTNNFRVDESDKITLKNVDWMLIYPANK
jgi:hypothetical protein